MARKPVKKRIQRKIAKKKPSFDKVIRAVTAKKPKVLNPKFELKIGRDEPDRDLHFVHPETIPDGVALQWVSNGPYAQPTIHQAESSGWKVVKEQAPIRGLVLMWAPQEVADSQRRSNIHRAEQQIREARELFGMGTEFPGEGQRFPLVSESFLASEQWDSIPSDAPPIDVEVTTRFRLSARFQEAASLLKITHEVYASRRLELYLRGSLGGILLPVGGALELFESGNFNIQSRNS